MARETLLPLLQYLILFILGRHIVIVFRCYLYFILDSSIAGNHVQDLNIF
jgi:hypothetical protein